MMNNSSSTSNHNHDNNVGGTTRTNDGGPRSQQPSSAQIQPLVIGLNVCSTTSWMSSSSSSLPSSSSSVRTSSKTNSMTTTTTTSQSSSSSSLIVGPLPPAIGNNNKTKTISNITNNNNNNNDDEQQFEMQQQRRHDFHLSMDASKALTSSRVDEYDFVTTSLPTTTGSCSWTQRRSDMTSLDSGWWTTSVVGVCGDYYHDDDNNNDDEDDDDDVLLLDPQEKLYQQLEWAAHMNLPAVILPPPVPPMTMTSSTDDSNNNNNNNNNGNSYSVTSSLEDYARDVMAAGIRSQLMSKSSNLSSPGGGGGGRSANGGSSSSSSSVSDGSCQLWIPIPMNSQGWIMWQRLAMLLDHHPAISILLLLQPMQTTITTQQQQHQSYPSSITTGMLGSGSQHHYQSSTTTTIGGGGGGHAPSSPPRGNNNKNMMAASQSPSDTKTATNITTATTVDPKWLYVSDQLTLLHHFVGGGPVKAIGLSTNLFLTNKRGYPTLSKTHQLILSTAMKRIGRTCKILISGISKHMPTITTQSQQSTTTSSSSTTTTMMMMGHGGGGGVGNSRVSSSHSNSTNRLVYVQYLQHIRRRYDITQTLDTPLSIMESDYYDVLQRPLEPLKDHLSFSTYEVFERDPMKYKQYRIAIRMAFIDWEIKYQSNKNTNTNEDKNNHNKKKNNKDGTSTDKDDGDEKMTDNASVSSKDEEAGTNKGHADDINDTGSSNSSSCCCCSIAVVGAGRGPLVTCALEAYETLPSERRPRQIVVYAVEKNPSAVMYLRSIMITNNKAQQPFEQQQQQHDGHGDDEEEDDNNNNSSNGNRIQNLWNRYGVKVIQSDLRSLTLDHINNKSLDIVVSELLGSIGDNELSPECLGALFNNNNNNSNNGTGTGVCSSTTISIPTRYTAQIAPISSTRLYQQARQQALYPNSDNGGGGTTNISGVIGWPTSMETPYVVRTHAVSQMAIEQDAWTFEHGMGGSQNKMNRKHQQQNGTRRSGQSLSLQKENNDGYRYACLDFSTSTPGPMTSTTFINTQMNNMGITTNRTATGTGAVGSVAVFGNGYGPYDTDLAAILAGTATASASSTSTSSLSASSLHGGSGGGASGGLLHHSQHGNGGGGGGTSSFANQQQPNNHSNGHYQQHQQQQNNYPWTCTGFIGTFTADLYRSEYSGQCCQISTSPSRFTTDMFSWFPLYFPIQDVIHVPAGASIRIHLWRKTNVVTRTTTMTKSSSSGSPYGMLLDSGRIWYEWSITVHRNGEVLKTTPIHNIMGRSSYVSL